MTERRVRRYVADLLRGRRPARFRVEDHEAGELRAAIALRAARPGADRPREEFVTDLHHRLREHLGGPGPSEQSKQSEGSEQSERSSAGSSESPRPDGPSVSRRRLVSTAGIAAGAAVAGAGGGAALTSAFAAGRSADTEQQTLIPTVGQWRTVAASADLPEGASTSFDLGSVLGFVSREGGRLAAVSGLCTHLGCKLALNPDVRRLDCPCHTTSFALDGQLLRHQLPQAPGPLPRMAVRETGGEIQIFAPPSV